jgi:hypothetical protein
MYLSWKLYLQTHGQNKNNSKERGKKKSLLSAVLQMVNKHKP